MDANTLATEVAPIIIQLPPKAVSTATAAVVVAAIAVIANIWVNNRTLKHQKESEEAKQKHEKEIEKIKQKNELKISKRKFLSEKYEEFSMQLKLIYNWSEELLTTMLRDLGKADYIKPEISSIHGATALSILYFDQFEDDLRALFDHQKNIFNYAYGQLEEAHFKVAKLNFNKIFGDSLDHEKIPSKDTLTLNELRNYAEIDIQKIGDHFHNMQKIERELIEKIIDHVKKDAPLYLYTSLDVE